MMSSLGRTAVTVGLGLCLAAATGFGCRRSLRTPITPPDTTSHNDGGGDTTGTGDFGTLYFQNTAATRWSVDGPVTASSGVIAAVNSGGDTLTAACTLTDSIDFRTALVITFTWRETVAGGATYTFNISQTGERWDPVPMRPSGALMTARFTFMLSAPVKCRFAFRLPPASSVRIADLKAYGY